MRINVVAKDFLLFIDNVNKVLGDVSFCFSPKEMQLVQMDSAHVMMVILKLQKSFFQEYEVDKEVKIAVNINNLTKVLKRAKTNDTVTIVHSGEMLVIVLEGTHRRKFKLPTIDIDQKKDKEPNLTPGAKFTMTSKLFSQIIADGDLVANSMSIGAKKDKLYVNAVGDISRFESEIGPKNYQYTLFESDSLSKFSMEYLKKISEASKIQDTVLIEIGNEYPIKVTYTDNEQYELSFVLAPRVDE